MEERLHVNVSATDYDKTSKEIIRTLSTLQDIVHGENDFVVTDSEFAFGWHFYVISGRTLIDVGLPAAGKNIAIDGPYLMYITRGSGHINGETVRDGDLVRGENLEFKAVEPTQLIVVHTN